MHEVRFSLHEISCISYVTGNFCRMFGHPLETGYIYIYIYIHIHTHMHIHTHTLYAHKVLGQT